MSYTKSEFTPYLVDPQTGQPTLSDTNNVRILEPNPIGETVPHEDLFIYASLTARQKSKTILTETNEGIKSTTIIRNDIKLTVPHVNVESVAGSALFKTKPALTTDWTEIGGWKSDKDKLYQDLEGFGITNIDVEIKSQTAPKIVIDFVDIRGATLFEQGSCSPYGLFFNMPYPIFELTLKGYYGKAVNYYLNLVKFTSKFNSDSGNMECRAEFIGYTFAFLSDTIVSYVQASQKLKEDIYFPQQILQNKYEETRKFYEDNGLNVGSIPGTEGSPWCGNVKSQSSKKCTTIIDLLKSLKTFEETQKEKIVGSTEYEELSQLIELESTYKDYIKVIYTLIEDLKAFLPSPLNTLSTEVPSITGQPLRFYTESQAQNNELVKMGGILEKYFNRNSGLLLNAIQKILDPNKKIGTKSVTEATEIKCLLKNPNQFTSPVTPQTIYSLYDDVNLNQKPWMIGILKLATLDKSKNIEVLSYPPITNESVENDNQKLTIPNVTGVIDIGYILADAERELALLNDPITGILTVKRRDVINGINDIVTETIGFKPTIRNIFTVLLCNTDAFMEILKNVAISAQKHHETETLDPYRKNGNEQIISGQNKVFPWPTYLEKQFVQKKSIGGTNTSQGTKEVYPGSKFPAWPEVKFVEDFIKAFLEFQDDIDILNEKTEGKPGYDDFAPINPIESQYWELGTPTPTKYLNLVGREDRLLTIGERLFTTLDHSYFQPIRLTNDSVKVPKIGVGNWNPIKNTNTDFIKQLGKIDAWNLLNSLTNQSDIEGTISTNSTKDIFISEVLAQLTKRNGTEGGVFKTVKGSTIQKVDAGNYTNYGFNPNEDYYVFKTKTEGVLLKTGESGEIYLKPNPLEMDVEYLFKIIPTESQTELSNKKINITIDTFSEILKNYKESLTRTINELDFSTTEFNKDTTDSTDSTKVWPGDLLSWDDNQQIVSFDKPQLFTTLAMSFLEKSEINQWWTSGNITSSNIGGDIVSNMGVISFWDDSVQNETELMGYTVIGLPGSVPKQTAQNVYNDLFYKDAKYNSGNFNFSGKIKLEGEGSTDVEVNPAIKNNISPTVATTTLVTTPLWLDNVNEFRKKAGNVYVYDENDQLKNLAYLFLSTLKTTPLITRIIDVNPILSTAADGYLYNDKSDDKQKQASIIWSLKALNTVAGVSKVPKAWLLALGSQLWRWREFVNDSTNDDNWVRPLPCIDCGVGAIPKGKDPLIQPGWDSIGGPTVEDGWTNKEKFRNNKNTYLGLVYGYNGTNYWTGKYKSVFGKNQNLVDPNNKDRPMIINNDTDRNKINFHYFNYFKDRVGLLGKYMEATSAFRLTTYYSWPQIYIAPHHIPYVSPEIFDDGKQGRGSDFLMITNAWIGYQDYITMMPTTRSKQPYNEANGGLDYDDTSKSTIRNKIEDGNLGFIMQNIPDIVKNRIVEEFERWATSDEWKNLLKIIDPVNFSTNSLMTSYGYLTGKNSPVINGSAGEKGYILALKPNDELKKLFTEQYWVLNSTPKIWYGYDNLKGANPTHYSPSSKNNFYEDGFIVSKSQFDTYLESFFTTYIEGKTKKIDKEKEKGKDETGGLGETILDDDDTKLGLYRTFKSMTDKWISSSSENKLFFNITNASDGRVSCGKNGTGPKTTLASHFQYVNRVMGDIGDLAVIDITKLNILRDNLKISLYQYISDLLVDNEYLFFPLPTYVNLTGQGVQGEDLKDMFRPSLLDIKDISCGPLFLCMYVGGGSRQLKFKFTANCPIDQDVLDNIEDDGFSFSEPQKLPEEIASPGNAGSDGYTAFRVVYGLENQNHFKNIQLDQSEFSETAESLMVIDKLSQQGGSDQSSKGQNLNAAYLTRSYSCQIESLGNMMIQPMTYFDLVGVPMFYGAYLITEVRHNFKPNHATTTFKGVRQPRATVPVVTDVALAMNLSFKGVKGVKGGSLSSIRSGSGSVDMALYPDISQNVFKIFGNPVLCVNKPVVTSQIYRSNGDFHGGLDIGFSNPDSGNTAKVISAYNGVVTNVGVANGFGAPPNGGFIVVRYGENGGEDPFSDGYYYFYVYGHCVANSDITVNTKVNIGKELGKAVWPNKDVNGNPVRNTGLHLHLQIHRLKSKGWSTEGKIDGSRFLNNKENCIGNVNTTVPTFALGYGSNIPQSTKINDVEKSANQLKTKNFLKSKGLNQIEVAGIMGNIQKESSFNPGALNAKDLNGYSSFGLIQWNQKYYQSSDVGKTVDSQLSYLITMPTYKKWLTQVKNAKNVDEATWYFADIVEVCDQCNKTYDIYKMSYQYKRSQFALDFYNRMKDTNDPLYWG